MNHDHRFSTKISDIAKINSLPRGQRHHNTISYKSKFADHKAYSEALAYAQFVFSETIYYLYQRIVLLRLNEIARLINRQFNTLCFFQTGDFEARYASNNLLQLDFIHRIAQILFSRYHWIHKNDISSYLFKLRRRCKLDKISENATKIQTRARIFLQEKQDARCEALWTFWKMILQYSKRALVMNPLKRIQTHKRRIIALRNIYLRHRVKHDMRSIILRQWWDRAKIYTHIINSSSLKITSLMRRYRKYIKIMRSLQHILMKTNSSKLLHVKLLLIHWKKHIIFKKVEKSLCTIQKNFRKFLFTCRLEKKMKYLIKQDILSKNLVKINLRKWNKNITERAEKSAWIITKYLRIFLYKNKMKRKSFQQQEHKKYFLSSSNAGFGKDQVYANRLSILSTLNRTARKSGSGSENVKNLVYQLSFSDTLRKLYRKLMIARLKDEGNLIKRGVYIMKFCNGSMEKRYVTNNFNQLYWFITKTMLLKQMIIRIQSSKSKRSMGNYFNDWKRITRAELLSIIKIQAKIRKIQFLQNFQKIHGKIPKIAEYLFTRYGMILTRYLANYFFKLRRQCKLERMNIHAIKIQSRARSFLMRKVRSNCKAILKIKSLIQSYLTNAFICLKRFMVLLDLQKILRKILLNRLSQSLQVKQRKKSALRAIYIRYSHKNDTILFYFLHWRNKLKIIAHKMKSSLTKITSRMRSYFKRNKRILLLQRFVIKSDSIETEYMKLLFNKWKRNALFTYIKKYICTIQKYFRKVIQKMHFKRIKILNTFDVIIRKNFFLHFIKTIKRKHHFSLLFQKLSFNNLSLIRAYLNHWKRKSSEIANVAAKRIQKSYRRKQGRTIFIRRKTLSTVCEKLMMKLLKNESVYLAKWKWTIRNNILNNSSLIIQKFVKRRYDKRKNLKMMNRFFYRYLFKLVSNAVKEIKAKSKSKSKIQCGYNILILLFNRKLNSFIFHNFIGFIRVKLIKQLIIRKHSEENNILKMNLMKWKTRSKETGEQSGLLITKYFRIHYYKKQVEKEKYLHSLLIPLFQSKKMFDNNGLRKRLRYWNYLSFMSKMNKSIITIQKTFRAGGSKKLFHRLAFKAKSCEMYRKVALSQMKAISKLIHRGSNIIFSQQGAFEKRYAINNIRKYYFISASEFRVKQLVFHVINANQKKNLANTFNDWKILSKIALNNAIKLQAKVRRLQFAQHFKCIRLQIPKIATRLFHRYGMIHNNHLHYYFFMFRRHCLFEKVNKDGKIIGNFVRKFLIKIRKANLKKLFKRYLFQTIKKAIQQVKKYKKLSEAGKLIKIAIIKSVLLKHLCQLKYFLLKMRNLCLRNDRKNKQLFLRKKLPKWANISFHLALQERLYRILLKIFRKKFFSLLRELSKKMMQLNKKSNILIIAVQKIIYRLIFSKLEGKILIAQMKKQFARIGKVFDDQSSCEKSRAISRIYQLYQFKILKKFIECLLRHFQNGSRKYVFDLIKMNSIEKLLMISMYNYQKSYNPQRIYPKPKRFHFKETPFHASGDKIRTLFTHYGLLLSHFTKFYESIIKKRKQEIFQKLLDLKKKLEITNPGFEIISRIIAHKFHDYVMKKLIAHYHSLFFLSESWRIFRMYVIRKIVTNAAEYNHFYRLCYLIKTIFREKEIATYKWLREILRKWRFFILLKKLAKKKLTKLYKDMHSFYLDVAEEFTLEISDSELIKEMEEKFRYFNPVDREALLKTSKLSSVIQQVSQKYSQASQNEIADSVMINYCESTSKTASKIHQNEFVVHPSIFLNETEDNEKKFATIIFSEALKKRMIASNSIESKKTF